MSLAEKKSFIRDFVSAHYSEWIVQTDEVGLRVITYSTGAHTNNPKAVVPWLSLRDNRQFFLRSYSLPTDVELGDPSKMIQSEVNSVMEHWRLRNLAKKELFQFRHAHEEHYRPVKTSGPSKGKSKEIVEDEEEDSDWDKQSSRMPGPSKGKSKEIVEDEEEDSDWDKQSSRMPGPSKGKSKEIVEDEEEDSDWDKQSQDEDKVDSDKQSEDEESSKEYEEEDGGPEHRPQQVGRRSGPIATTRPPMQPPRQPPTSPPTSPPMPAPSKPKQPPMVVPSASAAIVPNYSSRYRSQLKGKAKQMPVSDGDSSSELGNKSRHESDSGKVPDSE
jgi:hypothetical protein